MLRGDAVRFLMILFSATIVTTSALAADYRDAPYSSRRAARYPVTAYNGIRQAPPLYYVNAPPRFVQDLRTGDPGHWVVRQPNLIEQIFGYHDYY